MDPVYPALARQGGVQGTVGFRIFIGKNGRVQNLQLISGNLMLAQVAREAVRQWEYQPTIYGAAPIEVLTDVFVKFSLATR